MSCYYMGPGYPEHVTACKGSICWAIVAKGL
jgi:hypothetical protein